MRTKSKTYSDLTEIRDTLLMIDGVKLYKINKRYFEAFSECLDNIEQLKITDYKTDEALCDEAAKLANEIRVYFIDHLYFDVIGDPAKAMKIQSDFAKFIIPKMNRFVNFFYNKVCLKAA